MPLLLLLPLLAVLGALLLLAVLGAVLSCDLVSLVVVGMEGSISGSSGSRAKPPRYTKASKALALC
jgi:hypothetical protein